MCTAATCVNQFLTAFNPAAVFPLTFRLIGKCPNFLETIVPNGLKRCLSALIFVPIRYLSMPNLIFPQICQIFQSYGYHIAKNPLPLFQLIADLLKKTSLMGTLPSSIFGKRRNNLKK